jgi:4-oxalocrotonate tautomerase
MHLDKSSKAPLLWKLMGLRPSILVVILVFSILFVMFFNSQSLAVNPPPIQKKAALPEDDAIRIVKVDVVKILQVSKKDVTVVFQEAAHGNWYDSGIRL